MYPLAPFVGVRYLDYDDTLGYKYVLVNILYGKLSFKQFRILLKVEKVEGINYVSNTLSTDYKQQAFTTRSDSFIMRAERLVGLVLKSHWANDIMGPNWHK